MKTILLLVTMFICSLSVYSQEKYINPDGYCPSLTIGGGFVYSSETHEIKNTINNLNLPYVGTASKVTTTNTFYMYSAEFKVPVSEEFTLGASGVFGPFVNLEFPKTPLFSSSPTTPIVGQQQSFIQSYTIQTQIYVRFYFIH